MKKRLVLMAALSFSMWASAGEQNSIYESLRLAEPAEPQAPKTSQEPLAPAPTQAGMDMSRAFVGSCMEFGGDADQIEAMLKQNGAVPFDASVMEDDQQDDQDPSRIRGYEMPAIPGPYSVIFSDGLCSVSAVIDHVDLPLSAKYIEMFLTMKGWSRVEGAMTEGMTSISAFEKGTGKGVALRIEIFRAHRAGQSDMIFILRKLAVPASKTPSE